MKIKNLTIQKIKDICKNTSLVQCRKSNCPLYDHKWLCLGLRNMTNKELETDIVINKPQRRYHVSFKKHSVFDDNKVFRDNASFCFDNLLSKSIARPFNNQYIAVEEMVVKYRKSNKIIYKGKDYEEYLKVVGELNAKSKDKNT